MRLSFSIGRTLRLLLAGLAVMACALPAPGLASPGAAGDGLQLAQANTSEADAPKSDSGESESGKSEASKAKGSEAEQEMDLLHANATPSMTAPLTLDQLTSDLAFWTFILFLLLLAILLKFAWRPIMEGLEKRENMIATQIEEAQKANEKAGQTLEQYQAKLAAAADEVRSIIAEGKREAEAGKEKIIAEAQEAARRERERALSEINAAKNQALGEIAKTHVDHAFSLARQVVRKEINRDEHAQLIRESLDRFPANGN